MRVLIFSAFDGVPFTDDDPMRYAAIAGHFRSYGHEVLYISAEFSHLHKKKRKLLDTPPGFTVKLLATIPYKKNISMARLRSHSALAGALKNFLALLPKEQMPELVIGASPPLYTNAVLAGFCKKNAIPFIYDIQDLWPEEFIRFLPGKRLLKWLLWPYLSVAKANVRNASAITAVASDYLSYYQAEIKSKPSKVFFLGAETHHFKDVSPAANISSLKKRIFMLGNAQTLDYVLMAARAIQPLPNVELIVAGLREKSGSFISGLQDKKLERVVILDWVSQDAMQEMMPDFDAGLIWIDPNSKIAFPNRAFSYFASGLPVISNIRNGDLEKTIFENNLGLTVSQTTEKALEEAIIKCFKNFDLAERKRIQAVARATFNRNDIYHDYYQWALGILQSDKNHK